MIAASPLPASTGYAELMGAKRRRPPAVRIATAATSQAEAFAELAQRTAGAAGMGLDSYRRMIESPCVAAWSFDVVRGGPPRFAGFAMARWADRWVEHYLLVLEVHPAASRRHALRLWAERLVQFAEGRELFADVPARDGDAIAALIDVGCNRRPDSPGVHLGPTQMARLHRPAAETFA